MKVADTELVVFFSVSDEEPYEKIYYPPCDIKNISHLYWDDEYAEDEDICFCIKRRASGPDYWAENTVETLSGTRLEDLQTRHALIQLGARMWVPARNIANVWSENGKTMVDIGDLHPECVKLSVEEVLLACRSELLRVYTRAAPPSEFGIQDGMLLMRPQDLRAALDRIDAMISAAGLTPFLPGF